MLAGSGCECSKAGATKSIVQEYTQICMEDNGQRQWKTRRTEAIARWKFYVLTDDKEEEYCLPKLVLNVTLHKDTPMLSNENKSGTYMKECAFRAILLEADGAFNALHDARERGFSISKLRHVAQSLKDMQWIGEGEFRLFIQEVETGYNVNCEDEI